MVFKAVTGSYKENVWEVYKSELPFAEYITEALDVTSKHNGLYKNQLVSEHHWQMFHPSKVGATVMPGKSFKKHIVLTNSLCKNRTEIKKTSFLHES